MTATAKDVPSLHDRPVKNTICLFDVDGPLTPARGSLAPEMTSLLTRLRPSVALGTIGGSDLGKQQEQLSKPDIPVTDLWDFNFAENGLTAYRMGQPLTSSSFIEWLGEDKYKTLVNFILHYIADLDVPVKRGTFVEFRRGMINVSPIGRNASKEERDTYEKYDLQHKIRERFVAMLKEKFPEMGLTFSIGGQISFDVFPAGWDKTYCLKHVEAEKERGYEFSTIHFFGDKTYQGGNDYEIFSDSRTTGHTVRDWRDTKRILEELFPQAKQG